MPTLSSTPSPLVVPSGGRAAIQADALGWLDRRSILPFSAGDITAGSEAELQVAVVGSRAQVDLPRSIEASSYFAHLLRRAATGDASRRSIALLESYLRSNAEGVWENSWVRFPLSVLSPLASKVLHEDLRANKDDPASPLRADAHRFVFDEDGRQVVRAPISYLLKLAFADVLHGGGAARPFVRETGMRLLGHFINDNTSPETHSFRVVGVDPHQGGQALARETAKRYLCAQLLLQYANDKFELRRSGQEAVVFYSPHPPVRQKELNQCIPDSFYRELFISPCLSGWSEGEKKRDYMGLCHQILSRTQLNAVGKLREAGIITNNLVVLPNTSNISLANNSTHISLGSRCLTELRADATSGFDAAEEKRVGDLMLKVSEHFLSLFVGVYSAAPYRLDFRECHPETATGFLAHELDFTHLRMLWRRWRKKTHNRFLGQPISPVGPDWIDGALSRVLGLRGDFVPDFRLIDYPVALLSTWRASALDGTLGNDARLKAELDDMGVFDRRLSMYLPLRLREYDRMGFCGVEGRHYSLFESFQGDLARATELQALICGLAFRYVADGTVTHGSIPDSPTTESERRQIFFASAIGVPTFYVRSDSPNLFLRRILSLTERVRTSRRYRGYLRVRVKDFRLALVRVLREDGADLIESLGLAPAIADLEERLIDPERTALGKLLHGILGDGGAKRPIDLKAGEFNRQAEKYYRVDLRRQHMAEALDLWEQEVDGILRHRSDPRVREALREIVGTESPSEFVRRHRSEVIADTANREALRRLLLLIVLSESTAERAPEPVPTEVRA
ncbi:MAG: hypothetical protein AB7O52_08050 [Planctomycetota bacterium]